MISPLGLLCDILFMIGFDKYDILFISQVSSLHPALPSTLDPYYIPLWLYGVGSRITH